MRCFHILTIAFISFLLSTNAILVELVDAVQLAPATQVLQSADPDHSTTPEVRVGEPQAPAWHATLTEEHTNFLHELLDYWQSKSLEVKRYQCDFVRYDYANQMCDWRDPRNNQLAAASIMTGEIRYAAPDKACYETLKVYDFDGPPDEPGGDPKYAPRRDETVNREKWIFDGTAIHEFDFQNQKLYETAIPAEMQGKGLIHSPLPFFFGASKDDILNRFWVRVITPEGAKDEYWLEAIPKKIDDARNYKKLELVLSRDELFLPVMLQVFAPNYDPAQNVFDSRVFEFKNRQVNGRLAAVQDFFHRFVRPNTPFGWERLQRPPLQAQHQFDPRMIER